MNLVIHDMNENEWKSVCADYEGWKVVDCNGCTNPCVGCFGCWGKEPGKCVIKDDYNHMGELIHKAGEVVIISRYTYGGFSSAVKSVIDRCIGYILPYFEIYKNEMHHQRRYRGDKPITFIFRGNNISEEDKAKARKYIEAVCTNLKGDIQDIRFEECEQSKSSSVNNEFSQTMSTTQSDRTVFINCSMRGEKANSKKFLDQIVPGFGENAQSINIASYSRRLEQLADELKSAKTIVLGMPLYVDGIPSVPLRLMELMEQAGYGDKKRIYVIANMGFYESKQICNLLSMVKTWCDKCGYIYGGGLAIGAGEMMGQVLGFGDKGPARNVIVGLNQIAKAIKDRAEIGDIYADAYRFPRFMYIMAANSGMTKMAKSNGISKRDVLRKL